MGETLRELVYNAPDPYNSKEPQIDDFIGYYPTLDDPDFASYISRKREFYELASQIVEPVPQRGKLFKHQAFSFRYLTHYDRQLVAHQPATGKTCIMFAITEFFKKKYFENPDDPFNYKRAVIIFKNAVLEFNLIDNLVCKCTDMIYETTPVLQATSEEEMKKQIKKEIRKWYDFMTYGDFINDIKKFRRPQEISEYMSDKIFIIEEAHNLVMNKDRNIKEIEDLTIEEGDDKYEIYFKAFHSGHHNKIIMFSATPARNTPIDLRLLMNLILPLDNLMPNWTESEMNEVEFEEAEPYFRGVFSYIRAFDIGIERIYEGIKPENMNATIYFCPMSPMQYLSYDYSRAIAQGEVIEERNIERRREASGVEKRTLQASNLIYPDGTSGKNGAEKYLENINNRWSIRDNEYGQQLRAWYSDLDLLGQLSSKAAQTVEICLDAYPPSDVSRITEDHGVVFIYFPEFVYGSGAWDLVPILECYGYEYFSETNNIFQTESEIETGAVRELRPCPSSAKKGSSVVKSRLPKAKRVAVIESNTSKDQINAIITSASHYENRYGEYLQVIIVSEVAREGISIAHATREIIYGPSWNQTNQHQAEERVFRPTSYTARLEEYKAKLEEAGKSSEGSRFPVKIYLMASVYLKPEEELTAEHLPNNEFAKYSEEKALEVLSEDNFDTADVKLYRISEEKDRKISRWMRFGKRADAGCWVNYERNVQPGDIDGSATCDYDICAYECAGIREEIMKTVDWSTKILYYSDEEIDQATQAIKRLFDLYYSLRIDQIILLIKNIDRIFVLMALEKLINSRVVIIDRYGNRAILRENSGRVYLDKDVYSSLGKVDLTIYDSMLIGVQNPADDLFNQYIANMTLNDVETRKHLNKIMSMSSKDPNFLQQFDDLDQPVKVMVFENITKKYVKGEALTSNESAILDEYSYIFYSMPEPVAGLEKVKSELSKKGKGSGRKPNPENINKVKKVKLSNFQLPPLDMESGTERVYLHRLFSQTNETTGFNTTSSYMKAEGKLRIYKPSEEVGWRNLTQVENIAYNSYLQAQVQQMFAPFEDKFNIYGMILPPRNKFQIRDKETEAEDASEKTRGMKRGKVCSTWTKPPLVELITRIPIEAPRSSRTPDIDRKVMINYLIREGVNLPLDTYSNDKLKQMYLWYQSEKSIPQLCELVEEHFKDTGRLFIGGEGRILPDKISEQVDLQTED